MSSESLIYNAVILFWEQEDLENTVVFMQSELGTSPTNRRSDEHPVHWKRLVVVVLVLFSLSEGLGPVFGSCQNCTFSKLDFLCVCWWSTVFSLGLVVLHWWRNSFSASLLTVVMHGFSKVWVGVKSRSLFICSEGCEKWKVDKKAEILMIDIYWNRCIIARWKAFVPTWANKSGPLTLIGVICF